METNEERKGMPILMDIPRNLMDVAQRETLNRDWIPGNAAANKLFRCVECMRDVRELLQDGRSVKSSVKKRRKIKILLTPLHSLSEAIRDLLNDLENNPETVRMLPAGAREIIPKLRERLLDNTDLGKNRLLSQVRNKIAAHIDKDILPHEARALLMQASPPQVGWWLHSCITVLSDVLKLPVFNWSLDSNRKGVFRVMLTEPFIVTLEVDEAGKVTSLLAVHIADKIPRNQILSLLKDVVKCSAWLFGPNDPRIRSFIEDEPGSSWAKSLINLPTKGEVESAND